MREFRVHLTHPFHPTLSRFIPLILFTSLTLFMSFTSFTTHRINHTHSTHIIHLTLPFTPVSASVLLQCFYISIFRRRKKYCILEALLSTSLTSTEAHKKLLSKKLFPTFGGCGPSMRQNDFVCRKSFKVWRGVMDISFLYNCFFYKVSKILKIFSESLVYAVLYTVLNQFESWCHKLTQFFCILSFSMKMSQFTASKLFMKNTQ